jgi:type II secretory ATPase GspE/PulE/Tfp pilus assembly ATPase PilB-like protein
VPEHAPRQGFALESLGLHGNALDGVHTMLHSRSGLVVVAGLAGAGKTTTLYTLLDALGRSDAVVATVEEDMQYTLPHVIQTVVRPELGLTSAAALRAVLKQDPDIVMVGDLRDSDAALVAAQAAARGVLVLAGVEAPSAAGAIERLRTWGVSPLTLAATLQGVIAVEVVQRVCGKGAEEYHLARADSAPLEQASGGRAGADLGRVLAALKEESVVGKDVAWKELMFKRATQCEACLDGYQGKIGLQEVLLATAPIKELLRTEASAEDIDKEARGEGMLTIIEDGLFKAAQGVTTVEEVLRVA